MKTKSILTTLLFLCTMISVFAQGKLDILVSTNVNKLTCYCNESDFIYHKTVDSPYKKSVIEFPIDAFHCQKRLMERDLQKLFEANLYPTIKLTINNIVLEEEKAKANVSIKIKDISKTYDLVLNETKTGEKPYLKGTKKICLTDFKIEPPTKALGLVKVKNEVAITFCIPAQYLLRN